MSRNTDGNEVSCKIVRITINVYESMCIEENLYKAHCESTAKQDSITSHKKKKN